MFTLHFRTMRVLAGCFLAGSTVIAGAQTPGVGASAWILSSLPVRSLVAGVSITLRFEGDRVTGSDGCNRFSAPYTATATSFSIGARAASTQRACPDPVSAQAAAFMDALTRARALRVDAERLLLLGPDGIVLATLAPQPTTLAGTKWQVTAFNNGRQAVISVDGGTTVTMAFGPDGRVSGSAGCNTYTGPYTMGGTKLTLGPTAATRRVCATPDRIMEQEQQFLKALETVATARAEGDRLELRSAEGAIAITLQR